MNSVPVDFGLVATALLGAGIAFFFDPRRLVFPALLAFALPLFYVLLYKNPLLFAELDSGAIDPSAPPESPAQGQQQQQQPRTSLGTRVLLTELLHCRVFATAAFLVVYSLVALHALGQFKHCRTLGIDARLLGPTFAATGLFLVAFVAGGAAVLAVAMLVDRGADTDECVDAHVRYVVKLTTCGIIYWLVCGAGKIRT